MSSEKKVKRPQALFEKLIAQREHEGLTWREVADRSGVPIATLQGWAARLKTRQRKAGFVQLSSAPPKAASMEVVLGNGRRIRWSDVSGVPENLAAVIAIVESC